MRRNPSSLLISAGELSDMQHCAYLALCKEFTARMLKERPAEDWECLPDILDGSLSESFSRVKALGLVSCLTLDEWRHLQTRFTEEVYVSFNAVPPTLDWRLLGEQPLAVRCFICDQAHLVPSCPIG